MFGVPGILGNMIACIILSGKSMRNSFNLLLMALAVYDSAYVALDIIQKRSELHTNVYIILFPYLLYPLEMIAMTGSILLTVAIAIERYTAVHFPITYRQTMKNANAMRKRVATYLVPVTLVSIIFNVTKFLEMSYICQDLDKIDKSTNDTILNISANVSQNGTGLLDDNGNGLYTPSSDNSTSLTNTFDPEKNEPYKSCYSCDEYSTLYEYKITVTEFRKDPRYAIHFNWFRFIAIGVIPFILLVYLNAQVYSDLQKRQSNKRIRTKKKKPVTKANIKIVELDNADKEQEKMGKKMVKQFIIIYR